jgi:hypothetical protein
MGAFNLVEYQFQLAHIFFDLGKIPFCFCAAFSETGYTGSFFKQIASFLWF